MPEDAGSIYLSAFHHLGQGVGRVIENAQNEHQKNENLFGKAAELHEMGVIPDKEWNPIAEMHKRHQAINAGRLEALTQLYGAVALTGAKAKVEADKFSANQEAMFERQQRLEEIKQQGRAPKETTEQKEVSKVIGKEKATGTLLRDAISNPVDVTYGRFATQAEIDQGKVPKPGSGEPGSFVPTETGKEAQPVVRITSQSGRSYIMPRERYESLQKKFGQGEDQQANQIKADYEAGKISREAALKKLRSLKKFSVQASSDEEPDESDKNESDESDENDGG